MKCFLNFIFLRCKATGLFFKKFSFDKNLKNLIKTNFFNIFCFPVKLNKPALQNILEVPSAFDICKRLLDEEKWNKIVYNIKKSFLCFFNEFRVSNKSRFWWISSFKNFKCKMVFFNRLVYILFNFTNLKSLFFLFSFLMSIAY